MSNKILDLFAGVGGLSLGFELVKDPTGNSVFELYRAAEYNKFACDTLRKRYGDEKVIEGDLTNRKIHQQVIRECKGKVSIVMGGIPCQSFSLLGPRSGYGKKMEQFKEDKRDHLYKEFRKIVREIEPNIVVIENVKGILSKKDHEGNKIIDKIINDFEKLGYNFQNIRGQKYLLLNAANFGVPQKRERVILIGILKKWKDISVPMIEPTHCEKPTSNTKLLPYVTLFDAIGDLPVLESKITNTGLSEKEWNKFSKKNSSANAGIDESEFDFERFEKHKGKVSVAGKNFLSFVRPNGYKFLHHHNTRMQQFTDIRLFRLMKQGETARDFVERSPARAQKLIKYDMNSFLDKYRKQAWNQPSTTVFAHLSKDGNRFIHPEQARTLTPREAARIQSFPDDFVFCGPFGNKFKQIGNAVPPLMSYSIACKICSICQE